MPDCCNFAHLHRLSAVVTVLVLFFLAEFLGLLSPELLLACHRQKQKSRSYNDHTKQNS